jgi:prolyl-tRNA synthetase
MRVEIGPKDLAKNQVVVAMRHKAHSDKLFISPEALIEQAPSLLAEMQTALLAKAKKFRTAKTKEINSLAEFEAFFEGDGGFAMCHWNEAAIGHNVLAKHKVTPRCIPLNGPKESGVCLFTAKPSTQRIIFGKAY